MTILLICVAYAFSLLACMYAFDDTPWYRVPGDLDPYQPTILDLDASAEECDKERYIKNEICPAFSYFRTLHYLKEDYSKVRDGAYVSYAITIIPSAALFKLSLPASGVMNSDLLRWVVSIAVWIGIYFAVSFLYSRFFRLPEFPYSDAYLTDTSSTVAEYHESERAMCNNRIIDLHHSYLLSVRKSVQFRTAVARIASFVFGAIYVLFFFSTEL